MNFINSSVSKFITRRLSSGENLLQLRIRTTRHFCL
ncbi:hypothetical protein F443_20397 [Phytophthora nicotianae P1569]|uniref:Uncharacterized protein n=1 Tax=Phytophthora nicotianae P1569 TaxID=1317065 RepID=V9E3G7_PHYNI|nr:hypothetical protein F443_20397 [Phytophthora nicotianae P1569]